MPLSWHRYNWPNWTPLAPLCSLLNVSALVCDWATDRCYASKNKDSISVTANSANNWKNKVHFHCQHFAQFQHNDNREQKCPSWLNRETILCKRVVKTVQAVHSFSFKLLFYYYCLRVVVFEFAPSLIYFYNKTFYKKRFLSLQITPCKQ